MRSEDGNSHNAPFFMANKIIDLEIKLGKGTLLKEALDDYVAVGTLESLGGHATNEMTLKKFGNLVVLSGIVRGTFAESTYTEVLKLPAGYRPSTSLTTAAATVGGRTGIVEVQSAGVIRVNQITGATRAWMGINVVFFTE